MTLEPTRAIPKKAKATERRQNISLLNYATSALAIISWLLFLFALVMSYYAAPDSNYGVLRFHEIEIRQFWLTPLTGYLYILLWLSALGSYVAMMLDKYRNRRSADNPHYHLVLLLVVNLSWLIYILLHLHLHG